MTTDDREAVKLDLMRDEGLRRLAYVDSVGVLTIGYGRNLRDTGLSGDEAMFLLENDIEECLVDLATLPWFATLDGVRQRVLVNLRFNLGPKKFRMFKQTLAAVERGEYGLAADHMLKSKWARQVGRRATRLASMMRTGRG